MEELNEICEILMEKCACSWVRDKTNEMHDKYSALLTHMQGNVSLKNCFNVNPHSADDLKIFHLP